MNAVTVEILVIYHSCRVLPPACLVFKLSPLISRRGTALVLPAVAHEALDRGADPIPLAVDPTAVTTTSIAEKIDAREVL